MYKLLNYPIDLENPTIPGNPATKFERVVSMEEGAIYNTSYISLCTHNDSHVDAPGHFNKDGATVDMIPPEEFFFKNVVVIDASKRSNLEITIDDLSDLKEEAEFLLLHSGHSKHWKTPKYIEKSLQPWLSEDAANYLLHHEYIRAIGLDFMCIDKLDHIEQGLAPVHQMFCGINTQNKVILIYENLNLKPVINDQVAMIYAFPLQLVNIDGSPVTVVAEVKE